MIFAQTGVPSASTSNEANAVQGFSTWPILLLIAFAVACVWFVWSRSNRSNAVASKKVDQARPRVRLTTDSDSVGGSDSSDIKFKPNKRKNKGKSVSKRQTKKSNPPPKVASAKPISSSERQQVQTHSAASSSATSLSVVALASATIPTIEVAEKNADVVVAASTTTNPINPIFEPLRDVGTLRRATPTEKAKPAETQLSSDVVAKSTSPVGFEKIVPLKHPRPVAVNRWADYTPPAFTAKQVSARSESPSTTSNAATRSTASTAAANVLEESESQRPSVGLKNFVSRVKKSLPETDESMDSMAADKSMRPAE